MSNAAKADRREILRRHIRTTIQGCIKQIDDVVHMLEHPEVDPFSQFASMSLADAVLNVIKSAPPEGMTARSIAVKLGRPTGSVRGVFYGEFRELFEWSKPDDGGAKRWKLKPTPAEEAEIDRLIPPNGGELKGPP